MREADAPEGGGHLRADLALRLPDLGGLAGVVAVDTGEVERCEVEYHDTPDLRLFEAGIRLERRTGGAGKGWRLRVPHPLGEPLEARRPSPQPPAEPPEELCQLLVARLRHEHVGRVAVVRCRRRVHRLLGATGNALVQVADEEVTGGADGRTASTWRQLTVTGANGPLRDLVAARLEAAGARPSPRADPVELVLGGLGRDDEPRSLGKSSTAGEVLQAYLAAQAERLVALDPAVRVDAEDAVHKMRVAVRRLRSALAAFRRLVDRDVTEPVRAELKWLGGVLGPVRDAEVAHRHLLDAVAREPAELVIGSARDRLDERLRADHDAAHRAALVALSSDRYLRLLDDLDGIGGAVGGRRAEEAAREALAEEIGRSHRRMRRALDGALEADGPEARAEPLHEVRKAAKRVRYAAECGTVALGRRSKVLAARMEQAQEVLGEHQDSVVMRELLRRVALEAVATGEPAFTLGRLHALEQARGEAAAAAFLAQVDGGWAKPPSWLR